MSQKCPICPDIIWDMCYSMLIISGLLLSKFYCTHPPAVFKRNPAVFKRNPGHKKRVCIQINMDISP